MHRRKCFAVGLFGLICLLVVADGAHSARYRGGYASPSRYGGARPVSGYGSNLHRRFVLKQESRRAQQGLPVRNRGNVRWYR